MTLLISDCTQTLVSMHLPNVDFISSSTYKVDAGVDSLRVKIERKSDEVYVASSLSISE